MRNATLQVGQIVNTHGLRGEVKVVAWTDAPEVFETLATVYTDTRTGQRCALKIDHLKYQSRRLIVKFGGVDTIEEAEKLKGQVLYVDRAQLGEPEEGYYICDLLGIRVLTEEGVELGKISEVFSTGANSVYVVKPPQGRDILLPVIPDVVKSVDIDEEVCVVHLIEGLVD